MDFYTYIYLREDGTAYYVGKGSGDRAWRDVNRPTSTPKDPAKICIHYWDSEQDAFYAERMLIARYGRRDLGTGRLHNMSDGGEGAANPSPETRLKMSLAKRGKTSPRKGQKWSSEQHIKFKKARRGQPCPGNRGSMSEEQRLKLSQIRKGRPWSQLRRDRFEEKKKNVSYITR